MAEGLDVLSRSFARPADPAVARQWRPLAAEIVELSTAVIPTLDHLPPADDDAVHGLRVGLITAALGRAMGLGPLSNRPVTLGALLHDLGKALIPADVRARVQRDDAEHALYAGHPEFAVGLLIAHGPIDVLTRDAVIAHHERLDGRGTPYGLADDVVPLAARLVAVADTYDAWMRRPGPRDPQAALAVMQGPLAAGFDPRIVTALAELVADGLDRHLPSASA